MRERIFARICGEQEREAREGVSEDYTSTKSEDYASSSFSKSLIRQTSAQRAYVVRYGSTSEDGFRSGPAIFLPLVPHTRVCSVWPFSRWGDISLRGQCEGFHFHTAGTLCDNFSSLESTYCSWVPHMRQATVRFRCMPKAKKTTFYASRSPPPSPLALFRPVLPDENTAQPCWTECLSSGKQPKNVQRACHTMPESPLRGP